MKRILALLLAALMLVPVFASCDQDTPDTPDVPVSSDQPSDTQPPEDPGLVLDKTDFGGTKLRIIGMNEEYAAGYYEVMDIWAEAESSDPFEASVYQRIQDCETKYNFGIEYTGSKNSCGDVAETVSGGLDQYDILLGTWLGSWEISLGGNLLDMKEIPTIDLTHEWWDQNANTQLNVGNRMFYTSGDMSTIDDRCTRALYFNKTLAAANYLESPYELVRANKWTLEKFAQMCRDVARDVDGGGEVDSEDIVGFFYENGQFNFFMTGVGEHYFTLDENGMPVYSFLQDSESVTKMETVANMLIEDGLTINIQKFTDFGGFNNRFTYARSLFAAGKHLFTVGGALVIAEFADMEDEFGILPMPKWNMAEYFAYEGRETVSPTFKDKMLKRRYAQDSDSGDMLDIIYANKCFDMGFVANWGDMLGMGNSSIDAGRVPKASSYTRASQRLPALIQKDYDKIIAVGKEVTE